MLRSITYTHTQNTSHSITHVAYMALDIFIFSWVFSGAAALLGMGCPSHRHPQRSAREENSKNNFHNTHTHNTHTHASKGIRNFLPSNLAERNTTVVVGVAGARRLTRTTLWENGVAVFEVVAGPSNEYAKLQ
jgi:hypothetical protein